MTNKSMAAVGRWGSAFIPAIIVGASGLTKLIDPESWAQRFQDWGYPGWFSWPIGIIEVLAAIALVYPKTRFYGGAVIAGIMLGAAVTHIVAGEWVALPVNVIAGVLAGFSAWWTRPKWVRERLR